MALIAVMSIGEESVALRTHPFAFEYLSLSDGIYLLDWRFIQWLQFNGIIEVFHIVYEAHTVLQKGSIDRGYALEE